MERFSKYVPKLSFDKYKGNCGRLAVIGGSFEYTGAPWFAAYSALRAGADLAHIFCMKSAAVPIKSYSPETIVHPVLPDSDEFKFIPQALDSLKKWYGSVDSFVVGPGLGRNQATLEFTEELIKYLKANQPTKPVILDGDALFLVSSKPQIVSGCKNFILTPNGGEYIRLCNSVELKENSTVLELAERLKVNVFAKGKIDRFSNGKKVEEYTIKNQCPRRCGGQGDITAGILGLYASWAPKDYFAAAGAVSEIVKKAAKLAFQEKRRSVTTTDVISKIEKVNFK